MPKSFHFKDSTIQFFYEGFSMPHHTTTLVQENVNKNIL